MTHRRRILKLATFAATLFLLPGRSLAQKSDDAAPPPAAQARISGVLGHDQPAYHALREGRGLRMENPRQGVSAKFTNAGVDFQIGNDSWGMALRSYGYGDKLHAASAVAPRADANRVEYRRTTLTEWYVNGPLGLEQGFTLARAPGKSDGEPLTLSFDLSGNLVASVDRDRRGLTLNHNGGAELRYAGLVANDAGGRELRAWFELAANRLRLRVDDSGAQYPLIVDPFISQAALNVPNTFLGGFGPPLGITNSCCDPYLSISGDGNTIVVGAPFPTGSTLQATGAAYVFVKPSQGSWAATSTYAAKLTDGVAGDYFGTAVSISSDGSVIAIGAPLAPAGTVYVYTRPASGWQDTSAFAAKLLAGQPGDQLGWAATISSDGTTVAASAFFGVAAYVFVKPSSGWASSSPLPASVKLVSSDGDPFNDYGTGIAASANGSTVVVGAPQFDDQGPGEAYVYVKPSMGWNSGSPLTETVKLKASDGKTRDLLGFHVAVSGDGATIVAAAPFALIPTGIFVSATNQIYDSGAGYVFVMPAGGWASASSPRTETAKLTASSTVGAGNQDQNDLGDSISISGDGSSIVAGAPADRVRTPGSLYVYTKPIAGWASTTETLRLTPCNRGVPALCAGNGLGVTTGTDNSGAFIVTAEEFSSNVYVISAGAGSAGTTAPVPAASVSPTNLPFGNQAVGTVSNSQPVTLANAGTAPLHVTNVAATADFTSTQYCLGASPLAPGGNCTEFASFAPGSVGALTGTLTFTDDSGGTSGVTQSVLLTGTGIKEGTTTTIMVSSGTSLVGQPVTVNFSVVPLVGSAVSPSGAVTVKASTGESCTGTPPSGSCSLTFSNDVNRTISATYSGDTNFLSSASSSVTEVVENLVISVSPTSLTVSSGQKALYALQVSSQNGLSGTVSLACSGGPAGSSCSVIPNSITFSGSGTQGPTATLSALNSTGTFTVTFTATFSGVTRSTTATLTVK